MNRRELLKKLGLGGGAVVAMAAPALMAVESSVESSVLQLKFNGWDVRWTGWKTIPNQNEISGQWIAFNPDHMNDWGFYSSWPGAVSQVLPRHVYDLRILPDQVIPTKFTSESELEWMKNECLERLKRKLVEVGPPPYKPV